MAVGWVLPGQYVDTSNPPDGYTNVTVIPGSNLLAQIAKYEFDNGRNVAAQSSAAHRASQLGRRSTQRG